MSRASKILLASVAALVVVLIAGGAAFWYWVLRDDAPPPAALPEREVDDDAGEETEVDGAWSVLPPTEGELIFVGYRVTELFAGETIRNTAVGRTDAVTGTMTIAQGVVTEVEIVADLTQLESDQDRRDNFLRENSLQTNAFPNATFVLTEPIDLGEIPEPGEQLTSTAVGSLTLRDVTQPATIEIDARWTGEVIDVAGGLAVTFADYGITTPLVPLLADVDDHGEMEFQLVFAPA